MRYGCGAHNFLFLEMIWRGLGLLQPVSHNWALGGYLGMLRMLQHVRGDIILFTSL